MNRNSKDNSINNLIIKSIGSDFKGVRAHMRLKNGSVGLTPFHSMEVLKDVIKEAEAEGITFIKFEDEK